MNSPWPESATQVNADISLPAQSASATPIQPASKVPSVAIDDVKRMSELPTCFPSGSQVGYPGSSVLQTGRESAVSTIAGATSSDSVADCSEFSSEMELICTAEVRAEQQAAARETMLNLMAALQGALRMQRDLEEERAEDKKQIKALQVSLQRLSATAGDLGEAQDRLQSAEEQVKDLAHKVKVLEVHSEDARLLEKCRRHKKAFDLVKEFAESYKIGDEGPRAVHVLRPKDRIVLRFILTSWDHYVQGLKHQSCASVEVQTTTHGSDLELQEEQLVRVEGKLRDVQEKCQAYAQNLKQIQEERDSLLQQIATTQSEHAIQMQLSQDELMTVRAQSLQKDTLIERLREQARSREAERKQAGAAWETERLALQATIHDVSSQLGDAIAKARHMELLAQRAKRSTSELFQDQLAQLVADLENAKHRLSRVGKEKEKALEENQGLQRKLGQRVRQMELERQFLPLIHHAKGPLGMRKDPTTSQSDSCLPTMVPQPRQKLQMTQGRPLNPIGMLE